MTTMSEGTERRAGVLAVLLSVGLIGSCLGLLLLPDSSHGAAFVQGVACTIGVLFLVIVGLLFFLPDHPDDAGPRRPASRP